MGYNVTSLRTGVNISYFDIDCLWFVNVPVTIKVFDCWYDLGDKCQGQTNDTLCDICDVPAHQLNPIIHVVTCTCTV